jgi:general stress protein 26
MATVDGSQAWNRAMCTVRAEDDFTLWFVSMNSSNKVRQIKSNGSVCITVWEGSKTARVFGTAVLVADEATKQAFWDDNWERYFKGGKTDPECAVIKVTPRKVEYQDVEVARDPVVVQGN